MALTSITNAQDVNTLLDYVLGRQRPGVGMPTSAKARDAAARLADAANQKIHAGITSKDVLAAWPATDDEIASTETGDQT